ncbi:MAG TPA: hypothetical protein VL049_07570 [Candidatus Dormibacteraeota bacterium]|nr:hypothetical protein [Candidatus Dormibacteraeota bacterium]
MRHTLIGTLALLGVVAMAPSAAMAIVCPAGQHAVCHGGSGRGGGYRTTCACVTNPPPVCVTAWGTRIPGGTPIILYNANVVYAPDTCSAHALVATCDLAGVLYPPNVAGYTLCTVIYGEPND